METGSDGLTLPGIEDVNGDGVVNVLDIVAGRLEQGGSTSIAVPNRIGPPGPGEEIVIEPLHVSLSPGGTGSLLILIRNNTTPILGYSLDIKFDLLPGAVGRVTADVNSTSFLDARNLISAAGATRDPFFSVIQATVGGGVFVNTITDDNSTVLATDDVNDVLVEVVFTTSFVTCGSIAVELGPASALSDGTGMAIPFSFVGGTITIDPPCQIPAVSWWGVLATVLALVFFGSTVVGRQRLTRGASIQHRGNLR